MRHEAGKKKQARKSIIDETSETLTRRTEARTGGKFGNVDNLYSKLLIRLSMYASAYDGKWSSAKEK